MKIALVEAERSLKNAVKENQIRSRHRVKASRSTSNGADEKIYG